MIAMMIEPIVNKCILTYVDSNELKTILSLLYVEILKIK